jgi:hypothetical protein
MSSQMRYMLSKQNPAVKFEVVKPEEDEEE